eukprot:gb/GECG01011752.1/.p1 GENE.gb/GECG01011752.1/~~gb/GECG01011752.1/.p1  ORF type:complete len:110 (+),score=4.16 gb/GECG01011752.1/:1-330(+)
MPRRNVLSDVTNCQSASASQAAHRIHPKNPEDMQNFPFILRLWISIGICLGKRTKRELRSKYVSLHSHPTVVSSRRSARDDELRKDLDVDFPIFYQRFQRRHQGGSAAQ